jgi:sec-independent protein translocase protein TatB
VLGLGFGELVVVLLVALLVMGPHELPRILRKAGQWAGKLRRMAAELRAQSGIDDVLRAEGISDDLREITKLARGELDGVVSATRVDTTSLATGSPSATHGELGPYGGSAGSGGGAWPGGGYDDGSALPLVFREREYPPDGPDTGGALPDTALVYPETLLRSRWALDPIWTQGIDDGETTVLKDPAAAETVADGVGDAPRAADMDEPRAVPDAPTPAASTPATPTPATGEGP